MRRVSQISRKTGETDISLVLGDKDRVEISILNET